MLWALSPATVSACIKGTLVVSTCGLHKLWGEFYDLHMQWTMSLSFPCSSLHPFAHAVASIVVFAYFASLCFYPSYFCSFRSSPVTPCSPLLAITQTHLPQPSNHSPSASQLRPCHFSSSQSYSYPVHKSGMLCIID